MTLVSFTKKDIKNLCPDKPKIEMTNKLIEEIMEDMDLYQEFYIAEMEVIKSVLEKHLSNKIIIDREDIEKHILYIIRTRDECKEDYPAQYMAFDKILRNTKYLLSDHKEWQQ